MEPRRDVALVIHAGNDDLVAGLEAAAERPRHLERQAGHAGADDDLARRAGAEEIGHGGVRLLPDLDGVARGGKRAAEIAGRMRHGGAHRLDHRPGHLGAGGVVEPDGAAVGQGGKLAAHTLDGERLHLGVFFVGRMRSGLLAAPGALCQASPGERLGDFGVDAHTDIEE
jgi:hypothetical protein